MPRNDAEKSKNIQFYVDFYTICVQFHRLEGSKQSKMNDLALQYAFLNKNLQCFASTTFQEGTNETKNCGSSVF